jgi:maltodextrin utilization protein YvdJ
MKRIWRRLLASACALTACHEVTAGACAACYGQSDSPMAQGMNWGIFALLGVISVVLSGIAGFFIYVAKRSKE